VKLVLDPGSSPEQALIGEQESREILSTKKTGFLLEFIPIKIGAGMTDKMNIQNLSRFQSTRLGEPLAFKARETSVFITCPNLSTIDETGFLT
jgi:hypothetical protein